MIKIAILTPKNSFNSIKKALKDINYSIDYIFYDDLYKLADIYKKIAHKYNGIITSGPIGYENIKNHIEITTPVYYLEVSKSDLYKYLFEILQKNPNINFSRTYIDFISISDKNMWLEDIFSNKNSPILLPLDYSNLNLYKNLKNNYINLKRKNKIDFILTRISNMLPFLEKFSIPYSFLFPSENTIREIVLNSINDIKAKNFEKNKIIFGKIKSKKKLNEIKNTLSKTFKNCFLEKNDNLLDIFLLNQDFIFTDINKILQERFKNEYYIGWGKAENLDEARFYANKALKKNISYDENPIYICSDEGDELLDKDNIDLSKIEIINRLKNLNFSNERIKILINLFRKNETLNSNNLSKFLDTSERTASRILLKLQENNLAIVNISKSNRGRPKKIYFLTF